MAAKRAYGLGRAASEARMIAQFIAEQLGDTRLDGPHAPDAIRIAAARCPLVRTRKQIEAVVEGWQGTFHSLARGPSAAQVCFSAGRQLAFLKGVFS